MPVVWTRQTATPGTFTRPDGGPAKGVVPAIVHVRYRILDFDNYGNPLVEYLYHSLAKHYRDSHGQLDKLLAYNPPPPGYDPDVDPPLPPRTMRGVITTFVTGDVNCAGTTISWVEETWLLVPGTRLGCFPPPTPSSAGGAAFWERQSYWPTDFLTPEGAPSKGTSYDLILLNFEESDIGGGVLLPSDVPICNEFLPEVRAKAGTFWEDSHGQLDSIFGIRNFGPKTTILRNITLNSEVCPPPKLGHYWRITVDYEEITFHPGSILLGQVQISADSGCDCCTLPPNECCNPPGCSGDVCCTDTDCCIPSGTLECGAPCSFDFDACDLVFNVCCPNAAPEEFTQPAGCEYFVGGNTCVEDIPP